MAKPLKEHDPFCVLYRAYNTAAWLECVCDELRFPLGTAIRSEKEEEEEK